MSNTNNMRVIRTGIFTDVAVQILNGVLGQLSDGWGENNPENDGWWRPAAVRRETDGEVVIAVSKDCCCRGSKNNFINMSDDQVKAKFACWIKKTAKMEHDFLRARAQWKPDSQFEHGFFHGVVTTAQAFAVHACLSAPSAT